MAKRTVVWTNVAQIQLRDILEFFAHRNKNVQYLRKLYKEFRTKLYAAAKNP